MVNRGKYVSTARLRSASTHDNNFSSYEVIINTATSPSPEALMYTENSSQLFQLKLHAMLHIITQSKYLNIQSAITSTISDTRLPLSRYSNSYNSLCIHNLLIRKYCVYYHNDLSVKREFYHYRVTNDFTTLTTQTLLYSNDFCAILVGLKIFPN